MGSTIQFDGVISGVVGRFSGQVYQLLRLVLLPGRLYRHPAKDISSVGEHKISASPSETGGPNEDHTIGIMMVNHLPHLLR